MVEARQHFQSSRIVRTALDADRTLRHRWQHLLDREQQARFVQQTEAFEAGGGEQGRGDLAGPHAADPGLHVAPQAHDPQIRPAGEELGHPPQRGTADDRRLRQIVEAPHRRADQRVPDIRARQQGADHEPVRQPGRHVLHGMDGDVDPTVQQRLLDLLREQSLAADLGQRTVEEPVSGGADDLEAHGILRRELRHRRGKGVADHARLRERERRAAGADHEAGAILHGNASCSIWPSGL